MSSLSIKYLNPSSIYSNPKLLNRLRFLTNGGWGRKASSMYHSLAMDDLVATWIAIKDGQVIGWSAISKWRHSRHDIDVYVSKHFRKMGIGKQLGLKAVKYAKRNHLKCDASPWSKSGYLFYKSLGLKGKRNVYKDDSYHVNMYV